jgi:hypothetical protein
MPVTKSRKARYLLAGVAAFSLAPAVAVATAATASAQELSLDLPAGLACDFALHIEGAGDRRITRQFTDQNDEVVRVLTAGKGFNLTFTNVDNGNTLELPSNGSVNMTTNNADGTQTVQVTGHNVVILFPTDVPAGPSTTLYTGRLVYTVDTNGVFTVQSSSGPTTDICAALA